MARVILGESRLAQFARDIADLRRTAGLGVVEIARQCGRAPATISHMSNSAQLPGLETTRRYVSVCGGNVAEWEARWRWVKAMPKAPHSDQGWAQALQQSADSRLTVINEITVSNSDFTFKLTHHTLNTGTQQWTAQVNGRQITLTIKVETVEEAG